MNGIHEVTGSIPVWSTILPSPLPSFSQQVRPFAESPSIDLPEATSYEVVVWVVR